MNNSPTVLEIDTSAIKHNLRYFKSKIQGTTKLMVVIKAYAYGSDAIAIAKILENQQVDYIAVAYTYEGIALRKANIKLPILILHPQIENFELLIAHDLEPNLYSLRTLNHFIKISNSKYLNAYPIHLKINSGMNRLGFKEKDIENLTSTLQNTKHIKIISYYSHLASSESQNEIEFTNKQISLFTKITDALNTNLFIKPLKHILNTSGIINFPEAQFDMVRLGIGFYGFGNSKLETSRLKNVCNLKTKISQIQTLKKGEAAGYNRRFIADNQTDIGILPIGYADGINRNLSNGKGFVYINKFKVPIIGTICMDITMINLDGIKCKEGDEVIIFNHQDHILDMAKINNTISYQVLTSISQRVRREIV
ncbi:MAG: alanine racemase [Flavobacteriaceae bacterium]|nr:alanine racemase [Flavobacteriaceae bacterium]